LLSFILSRKHYPIKYNFGKIGLYLGLSLGLYFLTTVLNFSTEIVKYIIHSLVMIVFLTVVYFLEKPLRNVKS